jgi:anti-repressor protein
MENLVFKSPKGNPITTSLLVAIKFGKEHKNVIASIKAIIQSAENSAHFY